jgi:hypothetical protein
MNDEIPYDRWEHERETIRRMGYKGWQQLLKSRLKHAKAYQNRQKPDDP